tara:strand:+ start:352 stop:603 length:252 start_codon:yes stop_codon:yes gene_type:complete
MKESEKVFKEIMDNEVEHMAKTQHQVDKMLKKSDLEEPMYYLFLLRVCLRKIQSKVDSETYRETIYQVMCDVEDEAQNNISLN